MKNLTTFTLTLAVLALGAASASAAFIVQPTAGTASSSFQTRTPAKAIDGTGLDDATVVETNEEVPTTWPAHDGGRETFWLSDLLTNDPTPTITFDLGGQFDLTKVHLWNNYFRSDRGVNEVDITFSMDGTNFGSLMTRTFDEVSGNSTEGQDRAFDSVVTASHVKFTVQSVHGTNRASIPEVRFVAVPEPATLALLGLGGAVMLSGRKRRA